MASNQISKVNVREAQVRQDSVEHRWEVPNFGSWFSTKQEKVLEGNIFSPLSGIKLQLRIQDASLLGKRVTVISIKNCGENEVTLLKFSLKLEANCKQTATVPNSSAHAFGFQIGNSKKKFSFDVKESVTLLSKRVSEDFNFNWEDRRSDHWQHTFQTFDFVSDDVLVVLCSFSKSDCGSLAKDLEKELSNLNFTDWTIVCQDQKIPCHRFLLAARSPVFKRMFEQTGFNENKTYQNEIKDLSPSTLKELIKYIYTDKIDPNNNDISNLFMAADKYDIRELRASCENIMMQQLNTKNCVEYFRLARLYDTGDQFKEKTIEVIASNFQEIKKTPAFLDLQNQPNSIPAIVEITNYLSKKLDVFQPKKTKWDS